MGFGWYLGDSQVGVNLTAAHGNFASASDTADQVINTTTANFRVYRPAIGAFTGSDVANKLVKSVVGGVGRITTPTAGYVTVSWDESVLIQAMNANSASLFELVIEHYNSSGVLKKRYEDDTTLDDPITRSSPITYHKIITVPLVPVEVNDYFIVKFGFESSQSGRRLTYRLGPDNSEFDIWYYEHTDGLGQVSSDGTLSGQGNSFRPS